MTEAQHTLAALRQVIASLPEAERKNVAAAAHMIREVVAVFNDHGLVAVALVGAELEAAGD